jgi:hypothetical protein
MLQMTIRPDLEEGLKEIARLDLYFLKEKMQREKAVSDGDFEVAVAGLKKFFTLILASDGPLAVTSKLVDELWHTFILFTPQYRAFCSRAFGEYIDHQTHTRRTPVPASAFSNFVTQYERNFGPVDKLWIGDLPISVQEDVAAGQAPAHLDFHWSGWPGRSSGLP